MLINNRKVQKQKYGVADCRVYTSNTILALHGEFDQEIPSLELMLHVALQTVANEENIEKNAMNNSAFYFYSHIGLASQW